MREDGDRALARGVIEPGSEHFLKTHLFTIDFHLNGLYQIAT